MWPQLVAACLGFWLMAAPTVLEYGPPGAIADRILGPLIASFALIAAWEVLRAVRLVNLVCAAALLISAVALGQGGAARTNELAVGVLVAALSLVRGRKTHIYGGGWLGLLRDRAP
jgi:hypothetical protein